MSVEERFQAEHGQKWAAIAADPVFGAALQTVNIKVINRIATLTDEEIESHSRIILADLRGTLRHEEELVTLAQPIHDPAGDLGEPTYPTPEQEEEEALLFQQQGGATRTNSDLTPEAFVTSETFPSEQQPPPPKKRRKRRTKAEMLCQQPQKP